MKRAILGENSSKVNLCNFMTINFTATSIPQHIKAHLQENNLKIKTTYSFGNKLLEIKLVNGIN